MPQVLQYSDAVADAIATSLQADPFNISKTTDEVLGIVEVPQNSKMGDLAFPCFSFAKAFKKSPALIAKDIATNVQQRLKDSSQFSKIEAVGPYVNFHVNPADRASKLIPKILDGSFIARRKHKNMRVMVEYSQPNTHKAFHVGHMRNVALGDSLVRLYEWAGYEVVAANYIGDVGTHIARCLWYFKNHFDGEIPETRRGEFLGELYTNSTLLLDFKTLTRAPHIGVVTAKVETVAAHPASEKLTVVSVDTGSEQVQVVCGGKGFAAGDIVPYAQLGSRIKGRKVEATEIKGVSSVGMICSCQEISQGNDAESIYLFPKDTDLGVEIAELLRVEGDFPNSDSVIEEFKRRETGVAEVLQGLEKGDPELHELWRKTRQWSLDDFDEIYQWLDARFDHFFYESDVGDAGKTIVNEYLDKGVLVRSEGAIGADLTNFKMPFFLLLKSDGTGLYSTKDIALAQLKFDKFKIDKSIYVVDASQSLHFQQVFKTLELMGYDKAKLCYHLPYGMVVRKDGKMSSRLGNVILFSALQSQLLARINSEYLDEFRGVWPDEEIENAARRIAIATIKYGMLNHDNNKDIVFELSEWTNRAGNTGVYMMYAFARIQSILRKLEVQNVFASADVNFEILDHENEIELIRNLASFQDESLRAAEMNQPQLICNYVYNLAKEFNRFFENCPVIQAETDELKSARTSLIKATALTLQQGLALLGIQTIDRM